MKISRDSYEFGFIDFALTVKLLDDEFMLSDLISLPRVVSPALSLPTKRIGSGLALVVGLVTTRGIFTMRCYPLNMALYASDQKVDSRDDLVSKSA